MRLVSTYNAEEVLCEPLAFRATDIPESRRRDTLVAYPSSPLASAQRRAPVKTQLALVCLFLLVAATFGFAIPPGLFDPQFDGGVGGGVLFSIDPTSGKMGLGFELYWLSRTRFGEGITTFFGIQNNQAFSFSFDGLYYLDYESSGNGFAVIPIKLRLGTFGEPEVFGIGLASGIEWYALPLSFDQNDNIVLAGDPMSAGFFMTLKALAELDFAGGRLIPEIIGGCSLIGTIGGGAGGYVVYYYY